MTDPFNLKRFTEAQVSTYDTAITELRRGRKISHWMWFIFPQIGGLGSSSTSQFYALASIAEAVAYLDHPILGPRLIDCTDAARAHRGQSARNIFGSDDVKFRSSMTLFAVSSTGNIFDKALDQFFGGKPDPLTLSYLRQQ